MAAQHQRGYIASKKGGSPDLRLYKAARDGDMESTLDLLSSGANVRYKDIWDHFTPLMVAAYRGHASIVVLLLGKGASVMARAPDGTTALHYAAGFGHLEVVKALINSGRAVPNAKNARGETPIDWALGNGRTYIADLLSQARDGKGETKDVPRAQLTIALKQHMRVLRWRVKVMKQLALRAAEEVAAEDALNSARMQRSDDLLFSPRSQIVSR